MKFLCRLFGHRWIVAPEIKYEYGSTTAGYIEPSGDPVIVPIAWVCDEVCARCRGETWWPS
jgi:hypothetical protein